MSKSLSLKIMNLAFTRFSIQVMYLIVFKKTKKDSLADLNS